MRSLIYNKGNKVWKVLLTIDTRINNINTLIIKQSRAVENTTKNLTPRGEPIVNAFEILPKL